MSDADSAMPVPLSRRLGQLAGPAIAIFMFFLPPPEGLPLVGWFTAAAAVWMAVWWVTEAVPVAVTALLPLVLFPLLGVDPIHSVAKPYAHPVVFLFMGGFILAFSVERWNLHKRIALAVLQAVGADGRFLIAGFMLASALISMWAMNTSTTMMLLPIGLAVVSVIRETSDGLGQKELVNFEVALLLGIAYAATMGGMATLVGTAPNALLSAFMQENYATDIGFANWMLVGLPLSIIMLPLCWLLLTRVLYPVQFHTSREAQQVLRSMFQGLGAMTVPERRVGLVFFFTAVAWVFRPLLDNLPFLQNLSDAGIAITAAISLFLIPSGAVTGRSLMDWQTAKNIPWNLLLLFGGGLSLAAAVSSSGLAAWIGGSFAELGALHVSLLVIATCALIVFLTELTSNLATTATFLPVVAAAATGVGLDPILLTLPVALAASCAFMLPVATPPNAIVYGSGKISIPQMARAGIALNVLSILLISLVALFLAPAVFGS